MGEELAPSSEAEKAPIAKNVKDKRERFRPPTKIICRRLPPTMTEETFLEQIAPVPEYDYFYFSKPDSSLAPNLYCRAYINFVNVEDVYLFKEKFDDYIFVDEKGNEYPAIVEYAPFQRLPKKKRKKDIKSGTIESDPIYLEFLESLKEIDSDSREPKMEYSFQPTEEKKEITTPLLEFLATRKREERKRREERQRRRPRNRNAKDDENYDEDIKKIKSRENDTADNIDIDDDDIELYGENSAIEVKEIVFQGKGRAKHFKEQKRSSDEPRKKPEYSKKDKVGDFSEEKRDKKDKFKEKKTFEKKDKSKFSEKKNTKNDNQSEDTHSKNDKKIHPNSSTVATNSGEKTVAIAKGPIVSSNIKPFTTLPRLKVEELSKAINELEISTKKESTSSDNQETVKIKSSNESDSKQNAENIDNKKESSSNTKNKSSEKSTDESKSSDNKKDDAKQRRSSFESKDRGKNNDDVQLKRHKSLDENSESSEKFKEGDPKPERRIRNKDRPSIVIYQPGMGKFSKQRIEREKDNVGKKGDSSNKNVNSLTSSSNSVNSQD